MSNISDTSDGSPPISPSVEEVLTRVAAAADVKNDAALARALGVSPQTLSSWRKRGTVPHEAVAAFAADNGFSLDYLLLGKGPSRRYDGVIDLQLMEEIGMEIEDLIKGAAKPSRKIGGAGFAYYCSVVYNRISRITRPGDNPRDLISAEVKYLMDLLAREDAGGATVRVHPEVARHIEGFGATLREVYGGPGVSKVSVDGATSKRRKAAKSRTAESKKRR